ncbi:MAG: hypothetical protein ACRC42_02360, partial [Mycoplasma sp.]
EPSFDFVIFDLKEDYLDYAAYSKIVKENMEIKKRDYDNSIESLDNIIKTCNELKNSIISNYELMVNNYNNVNRFIDLIATNYFNIETELQLNNFKHFKWSKTKSLINGTSNELKEIEKYNESLKVIEMIKYVHLKAKQQEIYKILVNNYIIFYCTIINNYYSFRMRVNER